MKKNILIPFLSVLLFFLYSCIKDTDFNQAEDIALTPVIELDLIYFNVDADYFFDTDLQNPVLTVRDTTEIRFLDDSLTQKALKRVDFYFKFTNSIPREFLAEFDFISEQNQVTYQAQTQVLQGTIATPVITEYTQVVEGDDILQLTQANRVVVKVTIPSSNENLEGSLNLQSKATYYVEY